MTPKRANIGFISTRLAGTDGVSLESEKWEMILTELGQECFYFAGEIDRPEERSYLLPEAHFKHPSIARLSQALFGNMTRSSETSQQVQTLKDHLKSHMALFLKRFEIDLLVVENALSLPMNIPLGLALAELIAETNMPTVAHHHDFAWERSRFSISSASDYLATAFPPELPSIFHVVINSFAARQLALRTGSGSVLIPNVMDFANPPPPPRISSAQLKGDLGLQPEEFMLLQPTRVVPRKRIEVAVELTRRLDSGCVLVISHSSGDEGEAYQRYLVDYAKLLNVRLEFASEIINRHHGQTEEGKIIYALADVYQHADLVTYPSAVEGFGNAFLETIYYRRPIVMSTYDIFKTDIQPKGFRVIGFEHFVTDNTVQKARRVLQDPDFAEEITEHNYKLGNRFFSFETLEHHLVSLMNICMGA